MKFYEGLARNEPGYTTEGFSLDVGTQDVYLQGSGSACFPKMTEKPFTERSRLRLSGGEERKVYEALDDLKHGRVTVVRGGDDVLSAMTE